MKSVGKLCFFNSKLSFHICHICHNFPKRRLVLINIRGYRNCCVGKGCCSNTCWFNIDFTYGCYLYSTFPKDAPPIIYIRSGQVQKPAFWTSIPGVCHADWDPSLLRASYLALVFTLMLMGIQSMGFG